MSYLMLNHAITDKHSLSLILSILSDDNRFYRVNHESNLSTSEKLLAETSTIKSINMDQFKGLIETMLLIAKDDIEYMLMWLSLMDIKTMFTESMVTYLDELFIEHKCLTMSAIINYLFNARLQVTCSCQYVKITVDVLEALKNAAKYSKSYVDIKITGDNLIITNDYNPFQTSGTRRGLLLHPSIELLMVNGIATTTVPIEGIPHLTIADINDIATQAGWSLLPRVNDTPEMLRGNTQLSYKLSPQVIELDSMQLIHTARLMLLEIFRKHIDCTDAIWISPAYDTGGYYSISRI